MNRLRRSLVALACGALAAPAIRAEDDCGSMLETVTRFRGAVVSIEPLGKREAVATPVDDPDPRYVASVSIVDVAGADARLRRGEVWDFAIHSPSRTFGAEPTLGAPLELELHSMACDGSFRRFFDLRERGPVSAEPFEGHLEVGKTYTTEIRWDPDFGLMPKQRLRGPHHHGLGIDWMNSSEWKALHPEGPATSLSFEVVERRTHSRGENQWVTVYGCRIIDVREE